MSDAYYTTRTWDGLATLWPSIFFSFAFGVIQLWAQSQQGFGQPPVGARENARRVMQLGLSEYTRTRNEKALQQALATATRIDPAYPDPFFNLALLAEAHENWPYAVELLSFAVQSSPAESAIHKAAQQQLASVQAIQKNDAMPEGRKHRLYAAAVARSTTFLNAGLLQLAVSEAAVAAKIDPTAWESYAVTADALSRGKQPEQSRTFLNMALARAPVDVQTELRARAAVGAVKVNGTSPIFSPADVPILRANKTPRGWVLETNELIFDSGSEDLSRAAQARLSQIATVLPREKSIAIRIEGHTDSREAGRDANALSLKRAEAVRTYLDPTGTQFKSVVAGFGARIPVGSNETAKGRQQNRRVELWIE